MNEHDITASLRTIHQERAAFPGRSDVQRRVRGTQFDDIPQGHRWLQLPRASVRPVFGATRVVVAGAIVALFGSLMLVSQFARPTAAPGAAPGDPGTFSPTGSLAQPHVGHTATLLADGRVLVVGGGSTGDPIDNVLAASAEVWDPDTGSFSPAGALAEPRQWHTATLLPDGRVLVVGGVDVRYSFRASAEVWDPDTGSFSPAGSLARAHASWLRAVAPQPDGSVVVFGGEPYSAEVWDPATGTFSPAADQPDALSLSASFPTALSDGRILILGELGDAVVWDPGTGTTISAGSRAQRWPMSATLLPDGRVLVIGGETESTSAEVWDPATSTFSPAGSLGEPRGEYLATALPDGRVLVVGGCWNHDRPHWYCEEERYDVDSAEIWDPETNTFGPIDWPSHAYWETATALSDGRVLMVGGPGEMTGGPGEINAAGIWDPGDRQPPATSTDTP